MVGRRSERRYTYDRKRYTRDKTAAARYICGELDIVIVRLKAIERAKSPGLIELAIKTADVFVFAEMITNPELAFAYDNLEVAESELAMTFLQVDY